MLLEARDKSSSNQLQGTTQLVVNILDENDNAPIFEREVGIECHIV